MSHEWHSGIIVNNEQNRTSWHGLETPIDQAVTREDAMRLSGMDFQVGLTPVLYDDSGSISTVENKHVVMREDTGQALGVVGGKYRPIQNDALFDAAEAVVGSTDARYHAAVLLRGGAIAYVLLKRDEQVVPHGDEDEAITQYLYLATSHDGSMKFIGGLTNVRVVCKNTLDVALGNSATRIAIRHSQSSEHRIRQAMRLSELSEGFGTKLKSWAETLMMRPVDHSQAARFIEMLLPVPNEDSERSIKITNNRRSSVYSHWLVSPNLQNVRRTEWGLIQAVSEWDQHVRSGRGKDSVERSENKFVNEISGRSLVSRASDILMNA